MPHWAAWLPLEAAQRSRPHQPEHYENSTEALQRQETEQLCRSAAACLDGIGQKKTTPARRLYLEAAVAIMPMSSRVRQNLLLRSGYSCRCRFGGVLVWQSGGTKHLMRNIIRHSSLPRTRYRHGMFRRRLPQAAADNGDGNRRNSGNIEQWQCER